MLFAFQLEHTLAYKRPLLSLSMMDAGIFNTPGVYSIFNEDFSQSKDDAPQTNAVSRQVNITQTQQCLLLLYFPWE